ncbi:MAG: response regulator [Limisphaerales bacterium]
MNGPILLIEDSDNDIFLMERALRKAEITLPLQIEKNAERAVDYLSGKPPFESRQLYPLPCLILLDLSMPLMTGHEILKWRQGQPAIRRIPAIVLTLSEQRDDIVNAYDAGVNAYLVKPPTFDGLVELAKVIKTFWLVHNVFA